MPLAPPYYLLRFAFTRFENVSFMEMNKQRARNSDGDTCRDTNRLGI